MIGSEDLVEVNGKMVRGRAYPWGVVEVDNPDHSDFDQLKRAILGYALSFFRVLFNVVRNIGLIWEISSL